MSYLKNLESDKRWWERRIAEAELKRAEAICNLSIFYKKLEETEKLIDEELRWEEENGSKRASPFSFFADIPSRIVKLSQRLERRH